MRKAIFWKLAVLGWSLLIFPLAAPLTAAAPATIRLPPPDRSGGVRLMQAMQERQSSRDFAEGGLSVQQLSDLLWAAGGINRPEEGKSTVPIMTPGSDLIIHALLPDGLYLYDPVDNALLLRQAGDHRALAAGPQAFAAQAPLNVILSSGQKNDTAAGVIVGHSSQNIYLYCASAGLKAVTRMTMDRQGLRDLLKLPEGQRPLLILTVGLKP
ncbi:MAG: nitroreductase family protein [Candidatus Adiutrix sp.]|jgi:hypothetical protein|nr:nitroreductase family protein [Candidatus Adiutrix sp.]